MAGIDHRRASLQLRERFAFTKAEAAEALARLAEHPALEGAVLLSTCNRTELWLSCAEGASLDPAALLGALKGADPADIPFVVRRGRAAVDHLFALACGLRSRVFGEDQIIAQVKGALALARSCGSADGVLDRLFLSAVTAAKEVKTSVRLTAVDSSSASRAADLICRHFADLKGLPCLVIGNGEMGRLAASTLVSLGCRVEMTVRQYHSGEVKIPAGCRVIRYDERLQGLARCRALVSATASPHHTLRYEEAAPVLADGVERVLIDLAVPRDISSRLGALPGVTLYDIDDLEGGGEGEAHRQEVARAEAILQAAADGFCDWCDFRPHLPAVREVAALVADDAAARLERPIAKLAAGPKAAAELERRARDACEKAAARLLYGLREELDRTLYRDCIEALRRSARPRGEGE